MTDVTLVISGRRLIGWTSATVTRALETIAGRFSISLTERDPGTDMRRAISPGEACQVELDGERVLTGYVDSVSPSYTEESHTLAVVGRDATGDLVDCSAASSPGEWHDVTLPVIVSSLARPFGIGVRIDVDVGAPVQAVPDRGGGERVRGGRAGLPVSWSTPALRREWRARARRAESDTVGCAARARREHSERLG